MSDTNKQFDEVTAKCRQIFLDKMQDYGPSWRIFRLHGITDQIYIKVCNIRQRQETGVSLVGDDIEGNLRAITNYGVMAIIQERNGYADAIVDTKKAVYVFEFKFNKSAKAAIRQIREKGYANAYKGGKCPVTLVGINFSARKRNIDEPLIESL